METLVASTCPVASLTFAGSESGLILAMVRDPATSQQLWAVVKPNSLRGLQRCIDRRNAEEEQNARRHQFPPSIVESPVIVINGLAACSGQVDVGAVLKRVGKPAPEKNAKLFDSPPNCTPLPEPDESEEEGRSPSGTFQEALTAGASP